VAAVCNFSLSAAFLTSLYILAFGPGIMKNNNKNINQASRIISLSLFHIIIFIFFLVFLCFLLFADQREKQRRQKQKFSAAAAFFMARFLTTTTTTATALATWMAMEMDGILSYKP